MSGLESDEGLADLARESAQHAEEAAKEAQAAAESADEVARAIDQDSGGNSDLSAPGEFVADGPGPDVGGADGGDHDPSAGTDFSGGGYGGGHQGP